MSKQFTSEKPWGRYDDVARYTGIPLGTLRHWVHAKKIPHARLSPRRPRFYLADDEHPLSIPRWMAAHGVVGDE